MPYDFHMGGFHEADHPDLLSTTSLSRTIGASSAWSWQGLGFGSLPTARRTLAGYEGMAMIRRFGTLRG